MSLLITAVTTCVCEPGNVYECASGDLCGPYEMLMY